MKATSFLEGIHAQYIVDGHGNKTSVILKMEIYEKLLEELEDAYLGSMAEARLKEDTEIHDLD